MRCPRCGYEWRPKVPNPKECPRCKGRLDYKVPSSPRLPTPGMPQKIKEVSERMTTKRLPWIAAAVVIVVAVGLGSWVLLQPTAVTHGWTSLINVSGPLSGPIAVGLLGSPGSDYGIENIFIMKNGAYSLSNNPASWVRGTHYYENISYNNQTVNIPYEEAFDIVVVVRIRGDNVAYLTWDNVYTSISISGAFSRNENSLQSSDWERSSWYDNSAPIGAVGKQNPNAYLRFYYQLDNGTSGFKLAAGTSINFSENIYTWK
jgi:hypothetical protein